MGRGRRVVGQIRDRGLSLTMEREEEISPLPRSEEEGTGPLLLISVEAETNPLLLRSVEEETGPLLLRSGGAETGPLLLRSEEKETCLRLPRSVEEETDPLLLIREGERIGLHHQERGVTMRGQRGQSPETIKEDADSSFKTLVSKTCFSNLLN